MTIKATIIADSVSPQGDALLRLEIISFTHNKQRASQKIIGLPAVSVCGIIYFYRTLLT